MNYDGFIYNIIPNIYIDEWNSEMSEGKTRTQMIPLMNECRCSEWESGDKGIGEPIC